MKVQGIFLTVYRKRSPLAAGVLW